VGGFPPGGPPPPKKPGALPWVIGGVGALLVLALVVAGGVVITLSADRPGASAGSTPSTAATPSAEPGTTGGGAYQAGTVDLCARVDLAPVADLGVTKTSARPYTRTGDFSSVSECGFSLRSSRDGDYVSVSVRVSATTYAEAKDAAQRWQSFKDYTAKSSTNEPHHDVIGVGSKAYYKRSRNFYYLYGYDGNLYLEVNFSIFGYDKPLTGADLTARATRFANATMVLVRK